MTSAARPTWSAALSSGGGLRDGSSSAPTLQTCAKDQPGHLKLKLRQIGQDAPEELRSRNFRSKPETNQRINASLISGDSDVEIDGDDFEDEKEIEQENRKSINANSETSSENETEDEEEEEYVDDEEEELMKELEKIRKEREAERIIKERKAADRDPKAVLAGNPLLSSETDTSFGVKRRWDDDVVFKNQTKGLEEKPQKRFINDTTRSDFHRRFMDKFIK